MNGVSREDMLGVLRAYDALLDSLGFDVCLEPDEFASPFMPGSGGYVCAVKARYAGYSTGRLLWRGSGATQQEAREDMLRLTHCDGMPLAFSEAEAKMRIVLAGKDAFRLACKRIEIFASGFEGRR